MIWLTAACGEKKPESLPPQVPPGFEEFAGFYQRFHDDSLYQMAHIHFPLQGLPPDADSTTLAENQFFWQEEDWTMHRPLDASDADFQRRFIPFTEDLIEERIIHHTGSYGMIRRWAKLGGEWELIYYAGMNRMGAPEEEEEEGSGIDIRIGD